MGGCHAPWATAFHLLRPHNSLLMELQTPGHARKYKSRKERPCDACRRRKVCCIRESGDDACSLCRMQDTACRYDQGPTPRRRRMAGSALPVSIASESMTITDPVQQSTPQHASSSIVLRDGPVTTNWNAQYVGWSGDLDPFVLRHSDFNVANLYRRGEWVCLRVNGDEAVPAIFALVPDSHLDSRPPYYPPYSLLDAAYPIHHGLLSTYFDVIHSSFPLLDPGRFVKGNIIDLPLLCSMYGLTKPFCPAAGVLQLEPLDSFMFRALPLEARAPRLEVIEAALLFLQRHCSSHRTPTVPGIHAEVGSLVAMSYDVGLNVDPTTWSIPSSDRGRRKRLWWAVYIFDKWAAFGLGRPSFINEDSHNVPLLTIEDRSTNTVREESLPKTSAKVLVAMAALTQVLATILATFYSTKAVLNLATVAVLELRSMLVYFERQLNELYAAHLASLERVDDIFLDPTGTVFLAFFTAKIAVCRALLRYVPPTEALHTQIRAQSKDVVSCIINLLKDLQVTRLRAFWWSPISRTNFAIAGGFMSTMLLSSAKDDEIAYWTAEITRYRRLLDMQSLSFDVTKLAAARLSALADVSQKREMHSVEHPLDTSRQAFCKDFGIALGSC